MPRSATRADVERLFSEATAWLVKQVERYRVWDGPVRRSYGTGSTLLIFGRARRLVLTVLPPGRVRPVADLTADVLHLSLPPQEVLDPRPAIIRWLRHLAGVSLRARVEALAASTGLRPARVVVGERVTRWGSCSTSGTISLCYRLVMALPAVADAVIVHELCHLRHHNHGPRFRGLVRRHCPDHDAHMAWLDDHGDSLEV